MGVVKWDEVAIAAVQVTAVAISWRLSTAVVLRAAGSIYAASTCSGTALQAA